MSYLLKKRDIVLFLIVAFLLAVVFLYSNSLLSFIIPGYQNNPICRTHKLVASKDRYQIPSAANGEERLIVKVERWGEFSEGAYSYQYRGFIADINTNECEVGSLPESNGATVTIGKDVTTGYEPLVSFQIYIYAFAHSKSDEKYNMEKVIEDIANRYEYIKESDGDLKLQYRPETITEDTSYRRGYYIFYTYNGKTLPFHYVDLISTDNGLTWNIVGKTSNN